MSDTEEMDPRSSVWNQNNNNNNSDTDLDWQRDLQILIDMTEMESKMDTDSQLETKRSKQTSRENVFVHRHARPTPTHSLRTSNLEKRNQLPLKLKLPNENGNGNATDVNDDASSLLSSHSQQSPFGIRPFTTNKMELDQKLRILTSILSGLSGKLQVLEHEEKEHETQTEALSVRLNKLEHQVQNLKLDPVPSSNCMSGNKNTNDRDSSGSRTGKNKNPSIGETLRQADLQSGTVELGCNKIPQKVPSQTFYYVTPVSFLDLMEESD